MASSTLWRGPFLCGQGTAMGSRCCCQDRSCREREREKQGCSATDACLRAQCNDATGELLQEDIASPRCHVQTSLLTKVRLLETCASQHASFYASSILESNRQDTGKRVHHSIRPSMLLRLRGGSEIRENTFREDEISKANFQDKISREISGEISREISRRGCRRALLTYAESVLENPFGKVTPKPATPFHLSKSLPKT